MYYDAYGMDEHYNYHIRQYELNYDNVDNDYCERKKEKMIVGKVNKLGKVEKVEMLLTKAEQDSIRKNVESKMKPLVKNVSSNSILASKIFNNKNFNEACNNLKTYFEKAAKELKVKEEDIKICQSEYNEYLSFTSIFKESDKDFKKRKDEQVDLILKKENKKKLIKIEKIKKQKERNKKLLQKCITELGEDVYEIFSEIQKQKTNI